VTIRLLCYNEAAIFLVLGSQCRDSGETQATLRQPFQTAAHPYTSNTCPPYCGALPSFLVALVA
jgi:hypothetical protein